MSKADKPRFYNITQGSIEEVRYFLLLIKDLGYADTGNSKQLLESTSRLLNAYCQTIRNNKQP